MSATLKTLLTTAAILSMQAVFASDAELLGGGAQPEYGITTAEHTANDKLLSEAERLLKLHKTDKVTDRLFIVGNNKESTPAQRLKAADLLFEFEVPFQFLDIYDAVASDPASTLDQKLKAADALKKIDRARAAAIYTELAEESDITNDQKLTVGARLINADNYKAVAILTTLAKDPSMADKIPQIQSVLSPVWFYLKRRQAQAQTLKQ